MTFCAQYGNHLSFYGNIELGVFTPPFSKAVAIPFGAWPYDEPADEVMLTNHDRLEVPKVAVDNIAIIKRLKAELLAEEDTSRRAVLRDRITKARKEKELAFARMASDEDDEETFIMLLH